MLTPTLVATKENQLLQLLESLKQEQQEKLLLYIEQQKRLQEQAKKEEENEAKRIIKCLEEGESTRDVHIEKSVIKRVLDELIDKKDLKRITSFISQRNNDNNLFEILKEKTKDLQDIFLIDAITRVYNFSKETKQYIFDSLVVKEISPTISFICLYHKNLLSNEKRKEIKDKLGEKWLNNKYKIKELLDKQPNTMNELDEHI